MVKIKRLINTGILNNEWVGFQGDSEFEDSEGNLQLGYWTFKGIETDPKGTPYTIDDELDDYAIYGDCLIPIINENGNVCLVELGYEHPKCTECKWNYKSYHCMGCEHYYGNIDDLDPFCNYCNHTYGSDNCENCVWFFDEVEQ